MKIFTKSVLTLLLLCVANVVGAQVFQLLNPNGERNWATTDGYPYYFPDGWFNEGATKDVVDGALHIENTVEDQQFQLFILDWFSTNQGEDYTIKIWMKASDAGSANLSTGPWSSATDVAFEWEASDEFKMYQVKFTSKSNDADDNNEHIFFQSKFVGTIDIQKVQIGQVAEVKPTLSKNLVITENWLRNGDAEGDDLSSFPVSWDGPNNGGTANDLPEIVDGGVTGKCFQVKSHEEPSESWHTQFYIKTDEILPKGTEWALKMAIKADVDNQKITTSAQALPRAWKGGFIDEFTVGTSWKTYTWTGKISTDDFQSAAFDLNNGDEEVPNTDNLAGKGTGTAKVNRGVTFNFDNIVFGPYKMEKDARITGYGYIRLLFPRYTNVYRLVSKYADGRPRYFLPTSCFKVTIDGQEAPISTVEANGGTDSNGYSKEGDLYVFLDEEWVAEKFGALTADNKVLISFINPTNEKYRLVYIDEEGSTPAVEDFTDFPVDFDNSLGFLPDFYGQPYLMSADPEDKSFNLPATLNQFTLNFDREAQVGQIEAYLDNEKLKVEGVNADEDGNAKQVVLKRTKTGDLAEGAHKLSVTKVYAMTAMDETDFAEFEFTLTVGGGPSVELEQELATAKAALEEAADGRYDGAAKDALDAAITKYDAEAAGYTAPSLVNAAVGELSTKTAALNTHKTNCDDYDGAINKLWTVYTTNAENKFNTTDLYKSVAEAVAKYEIAADEEGVLTFNKLTDDEALKTAAKEVQDLGTLGEKWFTVGASHGSQYGGANMTTGYAALHERLRRGVELLTKLGVAAEDPIIVAANAELGDNDEIAEAIKNRASLEILNNIVNGGASLFAATTDPDTEETTNPSYDLSVFMKNPNIYSPAYSIEHPGWVKAKGNPFAWTCWAEGDVKDTTPYPEDANMHAGWHPSNQPATENTVEGLPAGVYTIHIDCSDNNSEWSAGTYAYVKLSDVTEMEEDAELDPDIHFSGYLQSAGDLEVEITDGQLTVGFTYGPESQAFINDVTITMTSPAEGYDKYAEDYQNIMTNVETAKTLKVRALEVYDLNGRRLVNAKKGINIVKKVMSDGSVKTQKVVK